MECQIDFARMGMRVDSVSGRRRVVHALIFTAVYSWHMFVWLTFSQTLEAVIDGCEAAWRFFGGYAGVNSAIEPNGVRMGATCDGERDVVDTGAGCRPVWTVRSGRVSVILCR